jgi:hypothetical protein
MMKVGSLLFVFGVIMVFTVAGCDGIPQDALDQLEEEAAEEQDTTEVMDSDDDIDDEPEEEEPAPQSCVMNSDCSDGNVCIDEICGKLADLYADDNNCDATCRINEVQVVTNRGDTYDFPPGKGSYTGAGALEWRLQRGPQHCATQDARIPILITKRNYGDVISEAYVTLAKGETTPILDHPSVPVEFTLKADDMTTTCT